MSDNVYRYAFDARKAAQDNAAQNEQDQADQAAGLEKFKATVETNRANYAATTEALRQKREADFRQSQQKLVQSQE
jgi:nitrate reductase assembly molybdenum cofactor insertion protein NarJ